MKKLESTLPNMFLVLTLIALVSAAALGFTYAQTKPILDEQARQREIQAVANVVPEFDNNPTEESITMPEYPNLQIYPATRGGNRVGTAVRSFSSNAYGGELRIMVGFNQDGEITGSTVLEHAETPGLGAKLTEEPFREQFLNRRPQSQALAVEKDGGEIDSITAATISSRAFVEAVNRAWEAVEALDE
jgi:electron transport complex protein RnfG